MLDLEEWGMVRDKMLRLHTNVTDSVKGYVQEMMTAFRPELMSEAEKQSKFGQEVMTTIEGMWVLEEECGVLEQKFQGFVGCSWDELDLDNVDVDFIEDLMLRAKPMNASLSDVRGRQMKKLAEVKTTYWERVKDLEGLPVKRPVMAKVKDEENPTAA